jgi:hypothetical protein
VTEDADLGMRLARFGYRAAVIASTTYEEAPARLAPWLRQRTRWFKGWMRLVKDPAKSNPSRELACADGGWTDAVATLSQQTGRSLARQLHDRAARRGRPTCYRSPNDAAIPA